VRARRREAALRGLWPAAALLVLAGCASIPVTHYYMLTLPPAAPAPQADPALEKALTIGVEQFTVDAPYDQEEIVYRVEGTPEVGFYAYHQWALPLSVMLARLTAEAFQGILGVTLIELRDPEHHYAAYLTGHLLALAEIDTPGEQAGSVQLALALQQPDGTTLWSGRFEATIPTHTSEVRAVVEAMQATLARALAGAVGAQVNASARFTKARSPPRACSPFVPVPIES
jgi:uncharacterized lipoprotein YmbA